MAKALSADLIKTPAKSTDVLLQALFVAHSDLFQQYDSIHFKALAIVPDSACKQSKSLQASKCGVGFTFRFFQKQLLSDLGIWK